MRTLPGFSPLLRGLYFIFPLCLVAVQVALLTLATACRLAEALDCGLDVLAGLVSITGR